MTTSPSAASVVAVCKKTQPGLPKLEVASILLLENFGVEGDYHAGEFVRHRYLAKKDPTQPNLRQVLIIDTTILTFLEHQGIHFQPGWMGENIILDGIEVMQLPIGTQLEIGNGMLEITEIRNPCYQLDEMHAGLLKAVETSGPGPDHRNAGMLARITRGGVVRHGDAVFINPETG
ncbi:MAG: MOSC domain-containing protein [Anaerolineales bacterium]